MSTFRKALLCQILLSLMAYRCYAHTSPSDLEFFSFFGVLLIGPFSIIFTLGYLVRPRAWLLSAAWISVLMTGLGIMLFCSDQRDPVALPYLLIPVGCMTLLCIKMNREDNRAWKRSMEQE